MHEGEACTVSAEIYAGCRQKLSQPLLETLSIVAFKQPVTKQEIEEIRGVNSDKILRRLLERDLIQEIGRKKSSADRFCTGRRRYFCNVSA